MEDPPPVDNEGKPSVTLRLSFDRSSRYVGEIDGGSHRELSKLTVGFSDESDYRCCRHDHGCVN